MRGSENKHNRELTHTRTLSPGDGRKAIPVKLGAFKSQGNVLSSNQDKDYEDQNDMSFE